MAFLLPIAPFPIAASALQQTLDQPFFPGKVILWILFMLSLASWAVIASKLVSFRKFRQGDRVFTNQLRRSKKPLEIHEKGWSEPMSLRQEVYSAGAGEAAFQLLGTIRQKNNSSQIEGTLSDAQMIGLRDALQRGIVAAESRLNIGISVLQATAAGAPFLGLLGMVWIMMNTFAASAAPEAISQGLSTALGVMAIGLIAATPAIIAQIFLRSSSRAYLNELGDFRLELHRLFERSLASVWNPDRQHEMFGRPEATPAPERPAAASAQAARIQPAPVRRPEPSQQTPVREPAQSAVSHQPTKPVSKAQNIKTRVYKSVRQDEPMINPIAMKAKEAQQQG